MNPISLVSYTVGRMFQAFKNIFLPNRKDLIGSIILSIPLYIIFGLSIVFLLPLIIACVFVVYFIRRIIKLFLIYWAVKVFGKRASKDLNKIKKMFSD